MKIQLIRSPFRLLINTLALGFALGALAYSPKAAFADPAQCQEMGCVNWSAEKGCTETMFCCVFNDGSYMCWKNGVLVE
jgi:hypothetical protein